jgi:hypothetical protein
MTFCFFVDELLGLRLARTAASSRARPWGSGIHDTNWANCVNCDLHSSARLQAAICHLSDVILLRRPLPATKQLTARKTLEKVLETTRSDCPRCTFVN